MMQHNTNKSNNADNKENDNPEFREENDPHDLKRRKLDDNEVLSSTSLSSSSSSSSSSTTTTTTTTTSTPIKQLNTQQQQQQQSILRNDKKSLTTQIPTPNKPTRDLDDILNSAIKSNRNTPHKLSTPPINPLDYILDTHTPSNSITSTPTTQNSTNSARTSPIEPSLISGDLQYSIKTYVESHLNVKVASIELTNSIKQHLLSPTNLKNWEKRSNVFQDQLRSIIKTVIYSRLPILQPLLLNEKVTYRQARLKLMELVNENENENDDDNNNTVSLKQPDLYALDEAKLILLIKNDANVYKRYKKSVISKTSKIIKEIFKLISIEKDHELEEEEDDAKSTDSSESSTSNNSKQSKQMESESNVEKSVGNDDTIVRSNIETNPTLDTILDNDYEEEDDECDYGEYNGDKLDKAVVKLLLKSEDVVPTIFQKIVNITSPIILSAKENSDKQVFQLHLGFSFVEMPNIPVKPTIIFHIVGLQLDNLQLTLLLSSKFKSVNTIIILGKGNSKNYNKQNAYSSTILNQLNNYLEVGDNKWYPLVDDVNNKLKGILVDYGNGKKVDERTLYIFSKKQYKYKPFQSLEDNEKIKYINAFERFANGYYFAEKFFNIALSSSFGINTPMSTMLELVYILHDELVDNSAEILDIGCGVPCLISGLSFLNKNVRINCSETDKMLKEVLTEKMKNFLKEPQLNTTLTKKQSQIVQDLLLNL